MKTKVNPANPLSREKLKELSTPNAFKGIGFIVLDIVCIALTMYLAVEINHILTYILAVMLIAGRQHSLLIQMHDAGHGNIAKNKALNDFVGEVICAWPMFVNMRTYRALHNKHHAATNTHKDPDFRRERFPTSRQEILKMLSRDILGLNTLHQLREVKRLKVANQKVPTIYKILKPAFYITALSLITYFRVWPAFIGLWVVPLFTWLKVCLRIRSIADHSGPGLQDLPHPFNTRTVIPNLFDRIFIAPRNSSYHIEHTVYASIPNYNLKKCHDEFMKLPVFQENARISHGYISLLNEWPDISEVDRKWEEQYNKQFNASLA